MKKTIMMSLFVLVVCSGLAVAQAQQVHVQAKPLSDSDIALLRQDVQSVRKELVTKAMQFTDAEAKGFWPVYQNYTQELQKVGDSKYQMIKEYAQNYDKMTDAKAAELTGRMFYLDKAILETRTKYWPQFQKVLTPKRAAKFYQVDRRLSLMIDLELASEIPILQ